MNNLELDWEKMGDLIPAIVQHANSGEVLMLGYMNQDALQKTVTDKCLTFYSRSKQRLWTKGESSGNYLNLVSIARDCDGDSLLIQALPAGPTCHLGFNSCFQPDKTTKLGFLDILIKLIQDRAIHGTETSYTRQLLTSGLNRCAQKVGEEAVETVIAAVTHNKEELLNEASDLIFHLLIMLQACELNFYEVLECLKQRYDERKNHV